MVTLKEIRTLLAAREYEMLRELHSRAGVEGIESCDEGQLSTVKLGMLEVSLFRGDSPGHIRSLIAMLDAVDRGNHPYDDIITMSTLNAEAAIAQAQLDALSGGK
jgi:hypothetical protein